MCNIATGHEHIRSFLDDLANSDRDLFLAELYRQLEVVQTQKCTAEDLLNQFETQMLEIVLEHGRQASQGRRGRSANGSPRLLDTTSMYQSIAQMSVSGDRIREERKHMDNVRNWMRYLSDAVQLCEFLVEIWQWIWGVYAVWQGNADEDVEELEDELAMKRNELEMTSIALGWILHCASDPGRKVYARSQSGGAPLYL